MTDRRALVVGNWKMNLDHIEAIHLVQQLGILLRAHTPESTDVVIAPPFVDLRSACSIIEADRLDIGVAAQHVNPAENGAYTGEISSGMLKRLGVQRVIVGHSERREMFGMTDELVASTVNAVLQAGLKVVLCVGEGSEVRDSGKALEYVAGQLTSALEGIHEQYFDHVAIAYEPIWAIGTGASATSEMVSESVSAIRGALAPGLRNSATILYGGSVRPENAEELIRLGGCDGFLVGGASLNAEKFVQIVTAVDGCYGKNR
ncbi:MAG: triose-phosphate isomerase [Actinomycetes bacterium]